ncbi:hypothetical protein [Streptomyces phaeoluteigriseus]
MAWGVGIGQSHEDDESAVGMSDPRESAVGMSDPRAPPLVAVKDDGAAVDDGGGGHVGRVGAGHVRLGHPEGRADLAAQQRFHPAPALDVSAVVEQEFGVTGVGCVAGEDLGRDE